MEQKETNRELEVLAVGLDTYETLLTKKYKSRKQWVKPFVGDVKSHLPGTIIEVSVSLDSEVKAGELLLVHEAMKMHNRVLAPVSGRVTQINVSPGDVIPKDFVMVRIEPK
jgi:biotin carboxyl carrier protein